ncbi:hypothetical protein BST61_g5209 [Cercospora zeina]
MRDFEREIIPMCQDEGMGLCPYGVLNQGTFQTKEGSRQRDQLDRKVSAHLEGLAQKKGVLLLSIALAYVGTKAPYVSPLIGARKVEHLHGSIDALSVSLSEEELAEVDEAYPFNPGFPHTFLSGPLFDGSKPRAANTPADVWLTKWLGDFDWVEAPKPIGRKESK